MQLDRQAPGVLAQEPDDHCRPAGDMVRSDIRGGLCRPGFVIQFFGWPFSFWMGAQGALIVYVALIWYYARTMNRLDREYGVDEEEEQ